MKKKIRIILADDHLMFLDGMEALLKEQPHIELTGCAPSGEEALKILSEATADLVIADLSMEGIGGLELTRQIRKEHIGVKTLICSMHCEGIRVRELLEAGVSGYLLKNCNKSELLMAIKLISEGGQYFTDEVKNALVNSMVQDRPKTTDVKLTRRELEVLQLIARELTNGEIAEKLFISLYTVETHRRNLMKKLNVKNGVGLIREAMDRGLLEDVT